MLSTGMLWRVDALTTAKMGAQFVVSLVLRTA